DGSDAAGLVSHDRVGLFAALRAAVRLRAGVEADDHAAVLPVGDDGGDDAELLDDLAGAAVVQAARFGELFAGEAVRGADDEGVYAAVVVGHAARDLGVVAEHGRVELQGG